MKQFIVGISGASGIILGWRVVDVLTSLGHTVHLVLSRSALITANEELGTDYATADRFLRQIPSDQQALVRLHKIGDFTAPIASGSFPLDGMIVVPCSMGTLAGIAVGLADNLLRRAADVTLKERRRLVLVPREAPLSEIHLENMLRITRMGGIIMPPLPAWYTKPQSLRDVEDFIVGRSLELLGVDAGLYPKWGISSQGVESHPQPLDSSPF
jgi:4-hydroxy-3-polyprenylbenzoate decarboxylase